jgi:hypothetical protein
LAANTQKEIAMQLTNGAIKATPQQPPMNPSSMDDFDGVDLDTFDLTAFVTPAQSATKVGQSSSKYTKLPEVEKFLAESTELLKMGETFEIEVVERGHKALYDLLASIYDFSLRIEQNEYKDKILDAIRTDLKESRQLTLKTNSNAITVMVRYVIRSDKPTISKYTKVLTLAQKANLEPADLPEFITSQGGIAQLLNSGSTGGVDKNSKERTALIRELFQVMGMSSKQDFEFDGNVVMHSEDKEGSSTKAEDSSFCVFVAQHVTDNKYKFISANELGKAFEDTLVKYLGKAMPNDLMVLEYGVRNLKKKISLDASQPESLRREMEKQLAAPMKHKKTAVIEAEVKEMEAKL